MITWVLFVMFFDVVLLVRHENNCWEREQLKMSHTSVITLNAAIYL